jgi:serine O-acetyltransferase
MFPNIFSEEVIPEAFLPAFVTDSLQKAAMLLYGVISEVFCYTCGGDSPAGVTCGNCEEKADQAACAFMDTLPEVSRLLNTDITAAYLGDPAAKGKTEIMLAYPSFEAVSIFRLAHSLHVLGVPLIPRMMTEYAHQKTGIDIHPGATVGESFFIDHGTGVVIGETCTIGKGVKLYQGVTLGAKSFEMDENGNPVKGIKRHPDIGDRVVIYAGATILGGNTHIGEDSVIGGNVWLTHSVPAGSKVYNTLSNKERS